MLVGITQRVETYQKLDETRDCLDQRWTKVLCEADIDFRLIPNSINNIDMWLEKNNFEGFILTGGNDLSHLTDAKNVAPNRDETEKEILNWSYKNKSKVLGVCRGMQLINCFLSGSLSKVSGHAGTYHPIEILSDKFNLNTNTTVNSYHNWGINKNDLAENLIPLALAEDGTIEAVQHNKMPWLGIMWHPERGDADNICTNTQLIRDFFSK